jgi:hypothetical protein
LVFGGRSGNVAFAMLKLLKGRENVYLKQFYATAGPLSRKIRYNEIVPELQILQFRLAEANEEVHL